MGSGSASMAQVNIRMGIELKKAGDATLDRANVTPTQLIRAIWSKLALGAEALDQIMEALVKEPSPYAGTLVDGRGGGDLIVERIARRQEAFEQGLGFDTSAYVPITDEEADELILEEWRVRDRERMVWHAE